MLNKKLTYPKVTIITATYNSAKTVKDTLTSIAEQNYPNIEHVVVDGLSKDNTLDIVQSFSHVAKVISEKDKGIYDAMNKGIGLATGEIVGILNSDDFYSHSEVVSNIVRCFQEDNNVMAVYADLVFVDESDTSKVKRTWLAGDYKKEKFLFGWMPPHPTFFVKKEVYEAFGTFNTSLKSAADYELMLRFLYKHNIKVVYLPDILIKMRMGGQSTASLSNRLKANKEDRAAWQLNELQPKFYTTFLKPLRKLNQFLIRLEVH